MSDFKQIGNSCSLDCYLGNSDNEQKDDFSKGGVVRGLREIIKLCKDEETERIALGAIQTCEKCKYKNPNVFHYLEKQGITF